MKAKIYSLTLFIILFTQMNIFAGTVYDEAINAIDRGLDKKTDVILVTALNRSLELYKNNEDDRYLGRILTRFDKILERKDAYFIVENFLGIYLKDKNKFEEILNKSLSKENKAKFMSHMNAIVREMSHGNG